MMINLSKEQEITVSFDEKVFNKLVNYAEKHNMSVSKTIEIFIEDLLRQKKDPV